MSGLERDGGMSVSRGCNRRILLAENDQSIANEVREDLSSRGYLVEHIDQGLRALEVLRIRTFELLIIDRMLPGLDGLTVIEQFRARKSSMPVLVLTALSAIDDRLRGLKAGGDDYLSMPFALLELAARVGALLRRPLELDQTVIRLGSLEMNVIERTVRRDGRELDLLPHEFDLLRHLMRRPEQLVTREMVLGDVWNYRPLLGSKLVDVHIDRLRRKLDGPNERPLIQSIHGAGFIFHVPD
jgi:two-component system, OmpR family, response regulator